MTRNISPPYRCGKASAMDARHPHRTSFDPVAVGERLADLGEDRLAPTARVSPHLMRHRIDDEAAHLLPQPLAAMCLRRRTTLKASSRLAARHQCQAKRRAEKFSRTHGGASIPNDRHSSAASSKAPSSRSRVKRCSYAFSRPVSFSFALGDCGRTI